ncbi:MAG: M3 family oligoendopeptidase [Clostridium sp.]|nr:M3 family oligoendopeptidase [Clostridium sp.]
MRWSLDELYLSFDSNEFKNDCKKIDDLILEVREYAQKELISHDNGLQKMEDYLKKNVEITNVLSKVLSFSSLTMSVDARNEEAKEQYGKMVMKLSELTLPQVMFERFLKEEENLYSYLKESDLLKEHEFYLKDMKKNAQYMLSDEEEILISKMSNTGSKAWTNLQNQITSTLMVDMGNSERLPLSAVRNLAYDGDPQVRREAFEKELKAYEKVEDSSSAALNGIKGEVITVSKLRGFKNPLEETLVDSRMNQETLEAMFTAIKESLPVFRTYLQRKAELLGHKNGLPFYDLFAPMGESKLHFTYEEAMDFVVKNFNTFSDKLGSFAQNAYEKNWIDVEPREGKRGGAFCSGLHSIGESRVMANFDGSFSNMTTLAHELGHGYHGFMLKEESILNSNYPMPIAETASIFCETIVVNAALKEMDDKEAVTILEQSIQDATQVIVDIYSRYLFETKLFEIREDHPLSVRELKETMLEAQKEAYGDGLDSKTLHPYMWLNKTHYYSAGRNFYNFPYAFGLLFAKGLYAIYLEKGDSFVKEYDDLLTMTGKNNIQDVAKKMNIDVTKPDFFRESLKLVEKDINKFLALTKDQVK